MSIAADMDVIGGSVGACCGIGWLCSLFGDFNSR